MLNSEEVGSASPSSDRDVEARYEPAGLAATEDALGNADILKILFSGLSIKELCRVSAVSKYWHAVSQAPELWNKIVFWGSPLTSSQVRVP